MEVLFYKDAFKNLNKFNPLKEIRWFFKRLKHCWDFAVYAWDDYDWDYHYIFKFLKFKLQRHRVDMDEDFWGSNSKKYSRQMRICELLLDRIVKDDYWKQANKMLESKWGPLVKMDEWEKDGDFYTWGCKRQFLTPERDKEYGKDVIKTANHEDMMRKQDIGYLFKYMGKHIQGWWT